MRKPNVVNEKSLAFAIRIVRLAKDLQNQKEFVLSRQVLQSGTAVGALVREAEHAESIKDFIHKLAIALKEANETDYWLEILVETDYISKEQYLEFQRRIHELLKLLTSIIKTSKSRIGKF